MDPRSAVVATKTAIQTLGGGFMISREAKALCDRHGLDGRQMYFRGRCGVLGEVDADVVLSAVVFFPAEHVRESWEGGRKLPAAEAAELYASACHDWGRRKLAGFSGAGRLAELLGYDRKTNSFDFPVTPRGFRALSRVPRLPRLVAQKVVDHFGDRVFHTVISRTVKFPDATLAAEPITTYAPTHGAATAYRQLARELIARGGAA